MRRTVGTVACGVATHANCIACLVPFALAVKARRKKRTCQLDEIGLPMVRGRGQRDPTSFHDFHELAP